MRVPSSVLLLILVLAATAAQGQETTGDLEGSVLDQDGAPADGVRVTVPGPDLQGERSATSSASGRNFLPALPIGVYTAEFTHVDYRKTMVEDVRIRLWYFAAVNPTFEERDVTAAGLGVMQQERVAIRFASKLNWRVNADNDLTLSFFGDPTRLEGPVSPGWHALPTSYGFTAPLDHEILTGGYTAALSGQHWLSDDLLLQSDVSGFWQRHESTPTADTDELYFYDSETGIVSGEAIGSASNDGERLRLNAGVRWDGQNLIDTQDNRAQSINDQWQPRAGFTWQVGASASGRRSRCEGSTAPWATESRTPSPKNSATSTGATPAGARWPPCRP